MSSVWNRWRAIREAKRQEQELEAEMATHLELAAEEYRKQGLSPEEAYRRALVRFGGFEQARETYRASRGFPSLESWVQDARYAFRTLGRERGFSITAALILALGIGANVAVFSVVNTMLLRPLPFHNPERLMWLTAGGGKGGLAGMTYTVNAFEEFQRHNRSFESVTAFQTFYQSIPYKLTGHGEPLSPMTVEVGEGFFPTLGIQPEMGRQFRHEECQKGGPRAALLSYPFWKRQYAGNPDIVGQAITINGQRVAVVGILPKSFDFGSVFSPGLNVDLFVPAVMDFWSTWGNTLALVGRLKPGVSVAAAQAESNHLFPLLRAAHPDWYEDYLATVIPLKTYVSGKLRRSLMTLWIAVGLVLLIVCVNLSNLLLARSTARAKEFAMRSALGAERGRIIRQLLTESLILASAGAVLGVLVAFGITTYVAHQESLALPLLRGVRVDGSSVLWMTMVTVGSGMLFGLLPAWRVSRTSNLQDALKSAGHGMTPGTRHDRLRTGLVVAEVALACVLLVGAGLLLRSFVRILNVDLGFQPDHVSALKLDYEDNGNAARRGAVMRQILEKVNALPGIEAAGVADMLPLDRNRSWGFQAKGRVYRPGELVGILVYVVSPGYFRAMGMRLLDGRDFEWSDQPNSRPVVIINRAAVRAHFPGLNPIGRTALIDDKEATVVGVLEDLHETSIEEKPNPEMYLPLTQAGPEGADLVMRTTLAPSDLRVSVLRVLREQNPGQPLNEVRPIRALVDHAVSPRRFFVVLASAFAGLALLLASLGIYGVISYHVTRQTQEIGIRIALGASRGHIQGRVFQQTLLLAGYGVVAGSVAAIMSARLIASLLFDVKPGDLETYVVTALLLVGIALFSGYLPARRAAKIEPIVALRVN